MRLLIDTHVLIWWTTDLTQVSTTVKDLLSDPDNEIHVSAVTAWEIAIKSRLGKLVFDPGFLVEFDHHVRLLAFRPLEISASHAVATTRLPRGHKDPFDNLLAAQALHEQFILATIDPAFTALGVETVW